MRPIPVEGDDARSSEDFPTYFMAPLSFAYREVIKRLDYSDHLSWVEKEAIRSRFVESVIGEVKYIVAHCPGHRRALLPSSIAAGMEHEDLMGFTAPDTRRLAIFEEDTDRNALFIPRTPEQFEFEAFREWTLLLRASDYMAILEHLQVRNDTGDDPETNDEYFLYSVNSTPFENPKPLEGSTATHLPPGDRDALRAHMAEQMSAWLALPPPEQPKQPERVNHFRSIIDGIAVKEIEQIEREVANGRFPGPGRPRKAAAG